MPKTITVDDYLAAFEHPHRAAIDEVRSVFSESSPDVVESIKWNAPTFSYRGEYLATIHVKATDRVMVIFHNARTPLVESPLLEGDYADGRRMAYFNDLDDVVARRGELSDAIVTLESLISA